MFFRRSRQDSTAVVERSPEQIFDEIDTLAQRNREQRDPELERRILARRHEAGAAMAGQGRPAQFPEPDFDSLHDRRDGALPEYEPGELTPGLLRASLLRDGALLVRGLVARAEAEVFADEIERAVEARAAFQAGSESRDGYYEELEAGPKHEREWVGVGGLWAADSPKLMFDMLEMFERCGLRRLIHGYLNEIPALSVQKCTMRKVGPETGAGWHQDGAFLGPVRALNVWMSLSRCGDIAPGLQVIPSRLDEIVTTGTEGAAFDWSVAPDVVERVAREKGGIVKPVFDPGDVLLFDEMNLHATAADPSMPNSRYAIESWFFGLSGFPAEYVPIAY